MATIKLPTGETIELTQEEYLNLIKLGQDTAKDGDAFTDNVDLNEVILEGITYELSEESPTTGDYIIFKDSKYDFITAGIPYKVYKNSWIDVYVIKDDEGDNLSLDGENYLTYKMKYTPREQSFIEYGRGVNELKEGDIVSYLNNKFVVVHVDNYTDNIAAVDGQTRFSSFKFSVKLETPVEKLLS
ncbi:hypothetical protein ACRW9N_13215 [Listeria aquatica]|uniref:hypothetical protein n=1 Tax=Listeria aquatica TaxID=1494960 RepID=UPI003EF990DE